MLTITVLGEEHWDQENEKFVYPDSFKLELEHSLVSLSKWESKWEVPFLGEKPKTTEMVLDYIECMILTPDPPADWISKLSKENIEEITAYFDSKQSATWFNDHHPEPKTGETITSELVYYWLDICDIDWQAQYWHLNRLLTLVKIHTVKQAKPKPMSRSEMLRRRRALNKQRLKEMEEGG
jgi:hypothetical protein